MGSFVYCDLDGVMVDLKGHLTNLYGDLWKSYKDEIWEDILFSYDKGEHLFFDAPKHPNADRIMKFILNFCGKSKEVGPRSDICFISTCGHDNLKYQTAITQDKAYWCHRYYPGIPLICVSRRQDKANYSAPGLVLIDDYQKNRLEWIGAGGIALSPNWILDIGSTTDWMGTKS